MSTMGRPLSAKPILQPANRRASVSSATEPTHATAQLHLDFALRLERRPPAPATPENAALVSASGKTSELLHEGGFSIPAYHDFRAQYSRQEWQAIMARLKADGAVTQMNSERWVTLANQNDDERDPESDRHFAKFAQRHSARVARHLRDCDAAHDRTQDSLRMVLQREYIPAHNRITSLAQAVGDGLEQKSFTEITAVVGDLPEAAAFVNASLSRWPGRLPEYATELRHRANRLIARDLVEVLDPYFRAGGTTNDASLTRTIRRELAGEGYHFFRSGRFCFLGHPSYRQPEAGGVTQEMSLQWLVSGGRRLGQEFRAASDLKELPEEIALTARFLDVRLGTRSLAASTTIANAPGEAALPIAMLDPARNLNLATFAGYEHADLRLQVFASGMSNITDIRALTAARHPIGVVAGLLRAPGRPGEITRAMDHLVRAVDARIPVFVDSGAFTAFRQGEEMEWSEVLSVYEDLGRAIQPEQRHLLSVVMPDVVGDQRRTRRLQRDHLRDIHHLQRLGVTPMLAIQKGDKDPVEVFHELESLIGNVRFVVALPCNEHAFSNDEVLDFASRAQPPRLHLLGRVRDTRRILSHLKLFASTTVISADANRLRAKVGDGRPLTMATRDDLDQSAAAAADEAHTDQVYDILHVPAALSATEADGFARFLGIVDETAITAWRTMSQQIPASDSTDESYGSCLGSLLHLHYHGHPDAMVAGIWKWCQHTARRSLSPETRARHVASAFIDDLMAMRANERAEECAHGHASLKHKRLAG